VSAQYELDRPDPEHGAELQVLGNTLGNGTLVGVTPPLPAGPTSFGIECSDTGGVGSGIEYFDTAASVVLIAGA
jgi:hypothetical protein